jgi:hypothetical protein
VGVRAHEVTPDSDPGTEIESVVLPPNTSLMVKPLSERESSFSSVVDARDGAPLLSGDMAWATLDQSLHCASLVFWQV